MTEEESDLIAQSDSDDDFDWEEVAVPLPGPPEVAPHTDYGATDVDAGVDEGSSGGSKPHIEITISTRPKKDEVEKCAFFVIAYHISHIMVTQEEEGRSTGRANEQTQLP